MSQAIIGKWGKNLAVRLPLEIAKAMRLSEGARVDIEAREDEIVIRPVKTAPAIADMFHGKDPSEWRELYAKSFDWGPDLGHETVEE